MLPMIKNFHGLAGTLSSGISAGATTAKFSANIERKLATLSVGEVTFFALYGKTVEIVKVVKTSSGITIARGIDSTQAQKHSAGTRVAWVLAAESARLIAAKLEGLTLASTSQYLVIRGEGLEWSLYAASPKLRTWPGSRIQFAAPENITLSVEECCDPPLLEIEPPARPTFYLTSRIYPLEFLESLDTEATATFSVVQNREGWDLSEVDAEASLVSAELVELLEIGYTSEYLDVTASFTAELVELLETGYHSQYMDVEATFTAELVEVLITTVYTPDLLDASATLVSAELI